MSFHSRPDSSCVDDPAGLFVPTYKGTCATQAKVIRLYSTLFHSHPCEYVFNDDNCLSDFFKVP